jgi:hypothetical protein
MLHGNKLYSLCKNMNNSSLTLKSIEILIQDLDDGWQLSKKMKYLLYIPQLVYNNSQGIFGISHPS